MQVPVWHISLTMGSLFQPKLAEKALTYSFQNRGCFAEPMEHGAVQLCTHSFGKGAVLCKLAGKAFVLASTLELLVLAHKLPELSYLSCLEIALHSREKPLRSGIPLI